MTVKELWEDVKFTITDTWEWIKVVRLLVGVLACVTILIVGLAASVIGIAHSSGMGVSFLLVSLPVFSLLIGLIGTIGEKEEKR